MTVIRLVRHPETQIPPGVCAGRLDLPITPGGRAVLAGLVLMAREFCPRQIVTSDARRSRETAEAMGLALDLEPLVDPIWREIHFGTWEGRRWEDLEQEDPTGYWEWMEHFDRIAPPEGESFAMLQARVVEALKALAGTGGRHLVVSHAGPIRAALAWVDGRPLRRAYEVQVPFGSVFDLCFENGKWDRLPYFYPGSAKVEALAAT